MLVVGVDPGSQVTGYGLLEKKNGELRFIHSGQINPSGKLPFYERIYSIYEEMLKVMSHHQPREMAIEDVFYGKNVKSALKLGHARGAVLIAAAQCGIRIFEYTPLEIKKAVVGYGRASKEQVRSMVRMILRLQPVPSLDTSDALAAAICHLNWTRTESAACISGRR